MKILVCGGRYFRNRALVFATLDAAVANVAATVVDAFSGLPAKVSIVHGAAKGADRIAHDWARSRGVAVERFPADWKNLRKAAGPIRNQRMIDEAEPDLCIAFPGKRGTADMVRRCVAAGIEVVRVAES